MKANGLLSGLPLKAAIDTVGSGEFDLDRIGDICGCCIRELDDDECWLEISVWRKAADTLSSVSGRSTDLFFEAGRNCGKFGHLGALEFLPWFLATPTLLLRNIEVITSRLDRLLEPVIDYVDSKSCRIIFKSKTGTLPPKRYFSFLQGYIISVIELWDCKIIACEGQAKEESCQLLLSLEIDQSEFRTRRALEELMVEPEFFNELYEGLCKIDPRKNERLRELILINERLRGIVRKAESEKEQISLPARPTLDEKYRSLLTTLYDGVIRVDSKGNITDINKIALDLLGYKSLPSLQLKYPTLEKLTGKKLATEFDGKAAPIDNEINELPFTFFKDDGMLAELLLISPAESRKKGGSEEVELIIRDPSFQSTYRLEFSRTRQFLEAIFLNNPSGLQILDTEGWTIRINPQLIKMFDLDVSRVVNMDRYNILRDPDLQNLGLSSQLSRALRGEQVFIPSLVLKFPDGSTSPFSMGSKPQKVVSVTAYPLKDHRGEVYNVVVSYTDITKSHLVETQIAQIDKLKSIGTLISGIAHDFNNFLGAIVPNADLIISMAGENEQVKRKATTIKTAAKRAAALTEQLVSFSRDSRGEMKPIDLNYSVREAVELLGNSIPTSVSINFEPSNTLPEINADPLQIHQVLINLIINASDAIQNGGIIKIKTDLFRLEGGTTFGGKIIPPGVFARLSVIDEGIGIPEKLVERVFDPFFTTKEKGRGTGLGLSVVHNIVKNHTGFINIETGVGEGTRFDVHLPVFCAEDSKEDE